MTVHSGHGRPASSPHGRGRHLALLMLLAAAAVAAFFFILLLPARADTNIAYDNFDSGNEEGGSGWSFDWYRDSPSTVKYKNGGFDGSSVKHIEIKRDGYMDRAADLSTYSAVRLRFWARAKSFHDDDKVEVLVSPDDEEWVTVREFVEDDSDDTYHPYDIDLGPLLSDEGLDFSDEFWVAFEADLEGQARFYVDEVAFVEPTPPGTPTPTASPLPTATPQFANIVLDSDFSDWTGVSFISDPFGDADKSRGDAHRFYWVNVTNEENAYFMLERYTTDGAAFDGSNGQKKSVKWTLWIDSDDDGNFTEAGDREVQVNYNPKATKGEVTVKVRQGNGQGGWTKVADKEDWGETEGEGGLRAEFRVAWSAMNVAFGQPIRMFAETNKDDRIPDSGDVQWSPASILGPALLAMATVLGIGAVWWFRGRGVWTRPRSQ